MACCKQFQPIGNCMGAQQISQKRDRELTVQLRNIRAELTCDGLEPTVALENE